MDKIQINSLAAKIAQMISADSDSKPTELAAVMQSLEKISERLDRLETSASASTASIQTPKITHPSQDHFSIAEAIVDNLFAQNSKEKACTFEPSKPCDHCSMCSSRGF